MGGGSHGKNLSRSKGFGGSEARGRETIKRVYQCSWLKDDGGPEEDSGFGDGVLGADLTTRLCLVVWELVTVAMVVACAPEITPSTNIHFHTPHLIVIESLSHGTDPIFISISQMWELRFAPGHPAVEWQSRDGEPGWSHSRAPSSGLCASCLQAAMGEPVAQPSPWPREQR